MKRITKIEAASLLLVLGLTSSPLMVSAKDDAAKTKTDAKERKKAVKQGKDSACGEGSCGTDEKGAKAAKKAHDKAADKKGTEETKPKTK